MSKLWVTKRVCSSVWRLCSSVSVPFIYHAAKPVSVKCTKATSLWPSEHRILFTQNREHSSSNQVSTTPSESRGTRRKSGRHSKSQKLHNRVLTEEEKAEERSLRASFAAQTLTEDVFGTLQQSRMRHREHLNTEAEVRHQSSASGEPGTLEDGLTHNTSSKPESERLWRENAFQPQIEGDRGTGAKILSLTPHRRGKLVDRYTDTFGTLQEDEFEDRIKESQTTEVGSHEERFSGEEEEDDRSHIRLSSVNRRHVPDWYGRKITKLTKKGKIREAIEVFEEWMLDKDRVMPNAYVFTSLISGLGHAGYTKKAFHLFNRMKKMGITPKPQTYTALFNACGNSPWKEDGLTRADNLCHLMQEKGIEPTFITGKAMIKAFAMCGDVRRAFVLMDQLSQKHRPDAEAFSFLLMACVSDTEAGLCYAIQVWRLMHKLNVKPDLPLYNMLIRCVRDCNVGDVTSLHELLGVTASPAATQEHITEKRKTAGKETLLLLQDDNEHMVLPGKKSPSSQKLSGADAENDVSIYSDVHSQFLCPVQKESMDESDSGLLKFDRQGSVSVAGSSQRVSAVPTIPDLLSPTCDISGVISLGDLTSKESQLALVGGVEGILGRMVKDGVKPNVITFSQLITVAIPTVEAEQMVLEWMKKMKVKPDIDLLNALIHKRCMRRDLAAARDVQRLIIEYKLVANQRTFGVLAMTCSIQEEAAQLLQDMEAVELQPNMAILGTLMYASKTNYNYKLWVLREAEKWDLAPNTQFLQNVEKALAFTRKMIVKAEREGEVDSYFLTPYFQERYKRFMQHYERWLKQTDVDLPAHPWDSFKPRKDEEMHQAAKTA